VISDKNSGWELGRAANWGKWFSAYPHLFTLSTEAKGSQYLLSHSTSKRVKGFILQAVFDHCLCSSHTINMNAHSTPERTCQSERMWLAYVSISKLITDMVYFCSHDLNSHLQPLVSLEVVEQKQ
jgi:hypothetical protein